jgi:hypothetical protein
MEVIQMAWRPTEYLIEGELDNTDPGKVTGWMRFAGMKDKVTFDLEGDFHRDIRGAKIAFKGDAYEDQAEIVGQKYMEGLSLHQTGKVGDITAGLAPQDYTDYPYIEWYSQENGRVVLELEQVQVDVIGTPIPACESFPISRQQQAQNMGEFLAGLAAGLDIPKERAICAGSRVVLSGDRRAVNNRIRGMKLLTKEIRKNLPPLYSQEDKGGKAMAHVKFFAPDTGRWTWYATEGSPLTDDQGHEVDFQFFGLVDGQEKELGYFNLSELEGVRGPMGLPIERDLHWRPAALEEIAPEMFQHNRERGEQ